MPTSQNRDVGHPAPGEGWGHLAVDTTQDEVCVAEFGAPLADFTLEDFHTPTVCARFGNPPYCFDILQQIAGVDFATVYENSEEFLIDGDLPARYISAEDLITNKLASGRLQDLADVEAIRNRQRVNKGK